MTKSSWEKRAEEAGKKYAESCDNESGGFLSHQLEAIKLKAFKASLAYCRANPPPETEALVTIARNYTSNGCDCGACFMCDFIEALAAFNEAKEKAGK